MKYYIYNNRELLAILKATLDSDEFYDELRKLETKHDLKNVQLDIYSKEGNEFVWIGSQMTASAI
jgi:hypothetical protein